MESSGHTGDYLLDDSPERLMKYELNRVFLLFRFIFKETFALIISKV